MANISQITDDDNYVVAVMENYDDVSTCINAAPLEALTGIVGLILHFAEVTESDIDDVVLLINETLKKNKKKEPLEAGTSNGSKQE